MDYKEVDFDDYQRAFIQAPWEDCKLLGVPGGGKTRVIIEKICSGFQSKQFTSNHSFLVLSFSRVACQDFISKGNAVRSATFSKNNVRTLHSLAGAVVSASLSRKSSSLETVIIAAQKLAASGEYDDSIRAIRCLRSLQVLFIDESQDISSSQYHFVLALKRILPQCAFCLVGDPNQNIYQFQGGSDRHLLDFAGKEYKLILNYRSTPSIVRFVSHIAPHPTDIRAQQTQDSPVTLFADTYEAIGLDVLAQLRACPFPLEEVAIVGPVRMCKRNANGKMRKLGLSYIVNLLVEHRIPYVQHYTVGDRDNSSRASESERKPGHVNLLTIHGSKGLEFQTVLVLNFHFDTFGSVQVSEDAYTRFQYLWYVACSRAKHSMRVYVCKDELAWTRLSLVPKDCYTVTSSHGPTELRLEPIPQCTDDTRTTHLHDVWNWVQARTPEQLYELESKMQFSTNEQTFMHTENADQDLVDPQTHGPLYAFFFNQLLRYLVHKRGGTVDASTSGVPFVTLFDQVRYILFETVVVPKEHKRAAQKLCTRLQLGDEPILSMQHIESHRSQLSTQEDQLLHYLRTCAPPVFRLAWSKSEHLGKEQVSEICALESTWNVETMEADQDWLDHTFRVALWLYIQKHEAEYMWKQDWSLHIQGMRRLAGVVLDFCKSECGLRVGEQRVHPNLALQTKVDLQSSDSLLCLQGTFGSQSTDLRRLGYGCLMTQLIFNPRMDAPHRIHLWNVIKGKSYEFSFAAFDLWDMMQFLCAQFQIKMKNALFVYDLETTGLDTESCQVIDRYVEEYNLGVCPSQGFCQIRGTIPREVVELTHITNQDVETGTLRADLIQEWQDLHQMCDQPTFLAHNGAAFDHKVMRAYGCMSAHTRTLDSKSVIRLLADKVEDPFRMKLVDVYKTVMGVESPYTAHRAKPDVQMVIDILRHVGFAWPHNSTE